MNILINEQESYKYCEDTKLLKNKLELGWLELCKRLYFIKSTNLADVSQYGSFDLFLDEIKIKPNTAIHMIAVYKKFCVDFGIEEQLVAEAGGYTNAYALLPMAKTPELARQALEIAKLAPSRSSIKEHVKRAISDDLEMFEEETCKHTEVITITVCADCKQKLIISEVHKP